MADLVSGLVSRVGKSRATPLCPYLFHLYHEHQLLSGTEEKTWRDHEVLLKYGESSETDDEPEDESGTDPESEEEEEERLKPSNKRQKVTPPSGRGTPPTPNKASPRPEGRPEGRPERSPRGQPVGKASCSEGTDPEDPFSQLITILCNVRADWEVKKIVLSDIGKLVDAVPDSTLPAKVAECITNPEEIRKQEAEVRRLQEEADLLKTEIFTLKEDMTATREMADETRKVVGQVKATVGDTRMAAAKAKLFDEGVL